MTMTADHPYPIDLFSSWLRSGERGSSSEAIVERLTGVPIGGRYGGGYPHDPADFRRCEMLLRAVPSARLGLSLMADVSPEWAGMVTAWDELVALGESEAPGIFTGAARGKAPKVFARMQEIREQARLSNRPEEES